MRLAACICFFNENPSIRRTIESVHDGVDVVICVDGRFPDYNYRSDLSDDGSREIIKEFPKAVLVDFPAPEVEKRNKYLQECKVHNCDYGLMIDADEFVLPGADWKLFRENCENLCTDTQYIYGVKFEYNHTAHHDWTPYPRLWYKPYDLLYYMRHNRFKHIPSGQTWMSSDVAAHSTLIDGIVIAGDDTLRDKDHIKRVYDYQVKLIQKENSINHTI